MSGDTLIYGDYIRFLISFIFLNKYKLKFGLLIIFFLKNALHNFFIFVKSFGAVVFHGAVWTCPWYAGRVKALLNLRNEWWLRFCFLSVVVATFHEVRHCLWVCFLECSKLVSYNILYMYAIKLCIFVLVSLLIRDLFLPPFNLKKYII